MAERLVTIGSDGAESYDYSTLSACEAGEQTVGSDLVTDGDYCVWEIRGTWASAETNYTTVSGWTTDDTHDVTIQAVGDARHDGKWTDTAHRIVTTNAPALMQGGCDWLTVIGLQCSVVEPAAVGKCTIGTAVNNGRCRMLDCIFVGHGSATYWAPPVYCYDSDGTGYVEIAKCLIYNLPTASTSYGGVVIRNASSTTSKIRNCTVIASSDIPCYDRKGTTPVLAQNCIAQGSSDGFAGTYESGSDYNCSNVAGDAPGANSIHEATVAFVDADNDDYHISPSDTTGVIGGGDDLSAYFTTDIDGDTITTWSIGADAQVATGGGSALTWSVSDSIAIGDGRMNGFGRPFMDTLTIGEVRSFSLAKVIGDAIALADTTALSVGFSRLIEDPLSIGDVSSRAMGYVRQIADALSVGEYVDRLHVMPGFLVKQVTDALSISDSVTVSIGFVRAFADALNISDEVAALIVLLTTLPPHRLDAASSRATSGPLIGSADSDPQSGTATSSPHA